jgi:hypothetical protein
MRAELDLTASPNMPAMLLVDSDEADLRARLAAVALDLSGSDRRLSPPTLRIVQMPLLGHEFAARFITDEATKNVLGILVGYDDVGGGELGGNYKEVFKDVIAIGRAVGAIACCWLPAKVMTPFEYFERSCGEFDQGGPFPMLSVVGIDSPDEHAAQTRGLSWFASQDIAISSDDLGHTQLIFRLARLVHYVVLYGPVSSEQLFRGLADGETIEVTLRMGEPLLNVVVRSDDLTDLSIFDPKLDG